MYKNLIKSLILSLIVFFPTFSMAEISETEKLKQEIEILKAKLDKLEVALTNNINQQKENNNKAELKNISNKGTDLTNGFTPTVKIGGNLDLEAAAFSGDKSGHTTGTNIRNARIKVHGDAVQDLGYKVEVDFSKNNAKLKKAFVNYKGFDPIRIKFGKFFQDFGISSENKFPENHPIFVLVNSYNDHGMQISSSGEKWYGSVGFATENFGEVKDKNKQSRTFFVRGTVAPIHTDSYVFHVGASGAFHKPRTLENTMSFSETFETQFAGSAIEVKDIKNIKNAKSYGLDFGAIYGPFSLQVEHIKTLLSRPTGIDNNTFKGSYGQITYSITGEQRRYNPRNGEFSNLVPFEKFDPKNGGKGAWEIALRYNDVSLNSKDIKGGKLSNFSTSLNWYWTENVHMMFSYIIGNTDKYAVVKNNKPKIFLTRLHIGF